MIVMQFIFTPDMMVMLITISHEMGVSIMTILDLNMVVRGVTMIIQTKDGGW